MSELEERLGKYHIKKVATPQTLSEQKLYKALGFKTKLEGVAAQKRLHKRAKNWILLKKPNWETINISKNYENYRYSAIPLEPKQRNDWSKTTVKIWASIVPIVWFSILFGIPSFEAATGAFITATFLEAIGISITATFLEAIGISSGISFVAWLGWMLVLAMMLETDVNYKCLLRTPVSKYKGEVPKVILQRASTHQQQFERFEIWSLVKHDSILEVDEGTRIVVDPILVGTYKDTNCVALIGMWGEDLEEINTIFNKGVDNIET